MPPWRRPAPRFQRRRFGAHGVPGCWKRPSMPGGSMSLRHGQSARREDRCSEKNAREILVPPGNFHEGEAGAKNRGESGAGRGWFRFGLRAYRRGRKTSFPASGIIPAAFPKIGSAAGAGWKNTAAATDDATREAGRDQIRAIPAIRPSRRSTRIRGQIHSFSPDKIER